MSDTIQARAIRQAAQTVSISIVCGAIILSVLLPICSVLVAKTALKMQAEQMRQQMSQPR